MNANAGKVRHRDGHRAKGLFYRRSEHISLSSFYLLSVLYSEKKLSAIFTQFTLTDNRIIPIAVLSLAEYAISYS